MEDYNQMNENTTSRANFLYASPVLAPNSSPYGRASSGSNVSNNQQTQMPISSFHLQSSDCFQSEAHPIVKTEASTSQLVHKFHYPLFRGHQGVQSQEGNENSSEMEAIKGKIIAHPQYSNLLEAFMDCQKVGAPPDVVARLSAARHEFESRQRSSITSRDTSKDPELDQFMEAYYDMLVKYREELTRPLQEAMDFMRRIETQLSMLSSGPVRIFNSDDKCEGVGSSEEDQDNSGGETELPEIDPRAEDRELKNHLLRKYSGYLSSLKQELSKKKKKGKLPKEARQKLLSWWELHYKWPYPSRRWHWLTYAFIHAAILQSPALQTKRPPRSGYRRTKINPSTWEIRRLNTPMGSNTERCLVTQMLEIYSSGWCGWKKNSSSKFEKTIPYALLCQVAGLKEYIEANPALKFESAATVVHSKISDGSHSTSSEFDDLEMQDEFYDAIAADSSSEDEESDDDDEPDKKDGKVKLKNVSWAITSLALKRTSAPDASKILDPNVAPVSLDPSQFHGSMCKGKDEADSDCWTSPSGMGFMIRGKTYLKDNTKVMGGDPLLKLIAVDWFKIDKAIDKIALHPSCLIQSEAGKKLPFVLIINLQIPAKPNYNLVLYYAAERPVNKNSLLGKFVDGTDMFRDARFKLIPSIVQGYWMVKRAVGTKACLLGKAVTCKYFRQDNFLEIDVDIGSSSVARSVIGLVLGYVTSLVVDLAILVEAKEEAELPEYLLGTVRLNRVNLDSAVPLEV